MAHCAQSPAFILHQVTCQFATGDVLFGPLNLPLEASLCGLVGRNGVGKTRLLRLLAGEDVPSGGHIERFGVHVWVAQQNAVEPQMTLAGLLGYEAVFAALHRVVAGESLPDDVERLEGHWDLQERLNSAFLEAGLGGFEPQRLATSLSGGERVKALLCAAFLSGADYLLLDEPTNHLDKQSREWLYHKLACWRGGALIASHDRELLSRMPRILELTPGQLRSFGGNYDDYQQQRDAEQREEQQGRLEIGIEFTLRLPARDGLQRDLAALIAEPFIHALFQHAAFTHDLPQPHRGEPGVFQRDVDKTLRQQGEDGDGIVRVGVEHLAGHFAHRQKALLDQHVQQLIAVMKVVVQHGRGDVCFARNGVQRGVYDPLAGKQVQRGIKQMLAFVRPFDAVARPAGAARLGGSLNVSCCHRGEIH